MKKQMRKGELGMEEETGNAHLNVPFLQYNLKKQQKQTKNLIKNSMIAK